MDNWDVVKTDCLLDTPWVRVVRDRLRRRESDQERDYFYLTSPGEAVATVALTENGRVLLTRQYRHPVRRIIYDLPAGRPEAGETPQQAAARELEEEAGYRAARWDKLAYFNQFPGAMQVGTHLFLARELRPGVQKLDKNEDLEVVEMPFAEALELVTLSQVIDGSMMLGLLLVAQKGLAP